MYLHGMCVSEIERDWERDVVSEKRERKKESSKETAM